MSTYADTEALFIYLFLSPNSIHDEDGGGGITLI